MGFERGGNGITLDGSQDYHLYLVFDLTSTREPTENFTLLSEMTGAGITLKLSFSKALPEAVEIFLIGEGLSQFFIHHSRKFSRVCLQSMDNSTLIQLADNCHILSKEFIGVASFDNFFSGRDFEKILDSAVATGQKCLSNCKLCSPDKRESIGF